MVKIGKWITGAVGWFVGGPVGALIGFAIGALLEHSPGLIPNEQASFNSQARNGFMVSLLVLIAAVAQADGTVKKSELDYVKRFLMRQFGEEATQQALILLRDILSKPIPLVEVCQQIRQHMNIASRRELVYLLFGVVAADGVIDAKELEVLHTIALHLGLSEPDYLSMRAMFGKQDSDWAYKVLEIAESASDDEIKKAYRRMALKHHPDKVANMGEDVQKAASEKFTQIKDAYEHIMKTR